MSKRLLFYLTGQEGRFTPALYSNSLQVEDNNADGLSWRIIKGLGRRTLQALSMSFGQSFCGEGSWDCSSGIINNVGSFRDQRYCRCKSDMANVIRFGNLKRHNEAAEPAKLRSLRRDASNTSGHRCNDRYAHHAAIGRGL